MPLPPLSKARSAPVAASAERACYLAPPLERFLARTAPRSFAESLSGQHCSWCGWVPPLVVSCRVDVSSVSSRQKKKRSSREQTTPVNGVNVCDPFRHAHHIDIIQETKTRSPSRRRSWIASKALCCPRANNMGIKGSPCSPPSPCGMSWETSISSTRPATFLQKN